MSSANLDLVRSIYVDWERGDFSTAEWADPDIEAVWADGPLPGSSRGLASMAKRQREVLDAWGQFRVEAESYRELDGELVLVLHRLEARGKTSGVDIGALRSQGAGLFRVGGAAVTAMTIYWDRERALADLDLASKMPSSNLDLVRSLYTDWERGDFSSTEWAHHEIEYVITGGPSPGSWRGVAAMNRAWRDFLTSWEDYRAEVEEYRELDAERVLVLLHGVAQGKTSGLDVGQLPSNGANLLHIHGAKVTRLVIYFDRVSAFADLGLSPEAD